ncbi:hypothetical protein B7494_g1672 [Chlorociboria aeruginascens]|nr:hypothetical protein B7494_g1672 [Chlorociboria aeruginascens]
MEESLNDGLIQGGAVDKSPDMEELALELRIKIWKIALEFPQIVGIMMAKEGAFIVPIDNSQCLLRRVN